jgi:hypothetical protein
MVAISEAWGQIFNGKDFLSPVLLVGAIQSLFEGGRKEWMEG